MHRSELADEGPQSLEISQLLFWVVLPIDICIGMQLAQISVDEMRLIQQSGFHLQTFVKLTLEQLAMDWKRTEPSAEFLIEISHHELAQIGMVGPSQPAE